MPLKTNEKILETEKQTNTTKKNTTKKNVSKTSSNKNTSKKSTNSKTTTKKASTSKSKSTSSKKKVSTAKKTKKADIVQVVEYYDLPYRYNETVVKILAQTPKVLFVYWDISDKDRDNYIEQFGSNFFNESHPFLLIHNETKNYDFEVEINDFANSWYLKVDDANCKYRIDLCRRFNRAVKNTTDYLYISSSNNLSTPNDHVLLENFNPNITFKNLKNNTISIRNFENIIPNKNINKLYKLLYKSNFNKILSNSLYNPSSNFFNI